jgi:hypothetical protein
MGIGVEEAKRLSLWEYQAVLTDHNRRTPTVDGPSVKPPDKDFVKQRLAQIGADPRYTN